MDLLHAHGLGDLLRELRRSRPAQTAAVCGAARLSFPELDARVNRLAHVAREAGVGEGDRILFVGQNCHRLLEGLLAAAKLGAVFGPVNWRQSAEELGFVLSDAAPRLVLWQEREIGAAVAQARAAWSGEALWIQHDGADAAGYEARLAAAKPDDPELPVDPGRPLLLLYTGAFGGRPNGAQLSHTALLLQGLVVSKLQEIDAGTVFLNSGPLFHVATWMTTLATLLWGGTNVFTPRSDPEELCRLIAAERCTTAFVMGPTVEKMVELNRDGRFDLSSLRSLGGSAAWRAMTSADTSPWGQRPGGYGQTEMTGLLTLAALGDAAAGTHGRPGPLVQVRLLDPDAAEVPPGEVGEITARGPTVMNGYLGRAELDAARQAGGWQRSGDLGRREPDGSLSFVGPKTRLIKSAAENIYPTEVEGCLRRHAAVADCAVIGVPDRRFGQNVKAIVVLAAGKSATADDLIEHCRAHIASYKKPRSVEFVDALPRRGFAVDYEALDARFGGGGYPGEGARPESV